MYSEIFKIIMMLNTFFITFISIYIIFSKKNEPEKFPENFRKTYILKPKKKIEKF